MNPPYFSGARHEPPASPPRVRLVGNTIDNSEQGVGALVLYETTDGGTPAIVKAQMVEGGSSGSAQPPPILTFATGSSSRQGRLTVTWPNGRIQVVTGLVSITGDGIDSVVEPTAAPGFVAGSAGWQ